MSAEAETETPTGADPSEFATRAETYLTAAENALNAQIQGILAEPRWGPPEVRVNYALDLIAEHIRDTWHLIEAAHADILAAEANTELEDVVT